LAETRFDVVIVGGGIAGSTLALALAGSGLSLALVEASPPAPEPPSPATGLGSFDSRVSAITPRSQALFDRLGVWQQVVDYRACPYRHMTVWDAEGTGRIEFDCREAGVEVLGYIVENRVLVHALQQALLQRNEARLWMPARLAACEPDGSGSVSLRLEDGSSLRGELLVAADGALSPVREQCGFRTREWDYGHHAVVATVETAQAHRATAWQRFLPGGPLAFLPLPGSAGRHYCSIVWSIPEHEAADITALEDEAFCAAVGEALEWRLGEVRAVSPRFSFPLRQRHAVDYVQPGVALVGDAAHTIHPLAGQGINLGLRDVDTLASELVAAKARGLAPGELAVLRRYQRQRKGENLLMMGAMDGFKRLFEQRALSLRWLRNAGLRRVNAMAPLKRELMRQAMGV
jgi:2-octaprenylphenol hydroxylase